MLPPYKNGNHEYICWIIYKKNYIVVDKDKGAMIVFECRKRLHICYN